MLVIAMLLNLDHVLIDVETAFLHGDLTNEIFMDCPPGIEESEGCCLKLNKTIYGLVQSAREYFKKFVKVLKSPKIGFKGGYADPCLLTRYSKGKGIVYIGVYIDDSYCVGNMEAIKEAITLIKESGFKLKVKYDMSDYLSCEIKFS